MARPASPVLETIFSEAQIAQAVEALGETLARDVDDDWMVVALLQGAMPFAVDLMRALARRGINPMFDSLWLESYRDARESAGKVVVRADLSRNISGRKALIVDDVFDTGRTIAFARTHLAAKGAIATRACAAVRKPSAPGEGFEHVCFDAPDVFLVGYGMDDAGRYRGLPFIGKV
jgi:hypoxanthine phosphoribosyltransferase